MVVKPLNNGIESKQWKTAFIISSILLVVIMLFLSKDYGQSGDEWVQMIYGQNIWDYFTKGDKQALDYTNLGTQYVGLEYYGGTFDFGMEVLHRWFPSIQILFIRHFFNALLGALMMVFTGMIARRLSGKWSIGLLALLFIAFSPRLFGESMNNPKDIPFASGFVVGIYFLIAILQDLPKRSWKHIIGMALGVGLAFGVRPAGGMLLMVYFGFFTVVYLALHKPMLAELRTEQNKGLKRLAVTLLICIIIGYVIGISTWPWGLQSPLSNPLVALKGMTNRETDIRVLFDGVYYWSHYLPSYYEFKWIFISNPLIVLVLFVAFIPLATAVKKKHGWFPVLVVLWCALFPLFYMIYKHSTVYDTWRHVFFVYPFWVVGAALSVDAITGFIKEEKKRWIPIAVGVAGLLPAVVWTVRSHPNQYVYFNELEGGAKGAYGYYDLDYYQNSGRQAANWMLKNLKPIPGRKIMVRSNMLGFNNYFANDTSWIAFDYGRYTERFSKDWDYYVAYPRYLNPEMMQNNEWKLSNTVHTVSIDGAPLCIVVQRKSTAGIDAFDAYSKKDYPAAIAKFKEFLATDTTDEFAYLYYGISLASVGDMNGAITQVNHAIKLDPSRAEFYDVLIQLYKATGNMQAAQQATGTRDELMMQQQPPQEEAE